MLRIIIGYIQTHVVAGRCSSAVGVVTTRHRPPAWGNAIHFSCPLSTVVQGTFSHIFFYIFTFTNLLWTLWTLWTYRDLLVKRLQNLKSDNKSVHSTVHGSDQLWTDHSSTSYSFYLSRVQ